MNENLSGAWNLIPAQRLKPSEELNVPKSNSSGFLRVSDSRVLVVSFPDSELLTSLVAGFSVAC